jgi:methionyl-tRNA formyltransferase
MNILLVGEESAAIRTLLHLRESGHRVVGVISSPKPKYGGPVTLRMAAAKMGYCTWEPESVKDPFFAQQLRLDKVDVLLNIHSLHIINPEVLRAPTIGCFNLHPGPLPRYAGLNPVCWALYFGEENHGVTLHRMTAEIDAGPIAYQSTFPLTEVDTGLSVSLRCVSEGLRLVGLLLKALSEDPASLPQIPQDLTQREYFSRQVPHQGRVIWSLGAKDVVNFVRACDFHPFLSPWGHPRTHKGHLEIQIVKARRARVRTDAPPGMVGYLDSATPVAACGDEWIFLDKVKVYDKLLNAAEVLDSNECLEEGGLNRSNEVMDSPRN